MQQPPPLDAVADDNEEDQAFARELERIANELGGIALDTRGGTAPMPADIQVDMDERTPDSIAVNARTEQEAMGALITHYGLSEITAIRSLDPGWLAFAGDADRNNWFRLAAYLQTRFRHTRYTPEVSFSRFTGRWAKQSRKAAASGAGGTRELVVSMVVGLSPQGVAAVLARRGSSNKHYLFARSVHDTDPAPWRAHEATPALAGLPRCASIDRHTVAMWCEPGVLVVVPDVLDRASVPVQIRLDPTAPPVESVLANSEYAVVVHTNGDATVVDYRHSVSYAVGAFLMPPVSQPATEPSATPPPTPAAVNPLTGEALEAPQPPSVAVEQYERHAIASMAFDELNSRGVVFSTALGWLVHGELAPPGTAGADAHAFLSTSLAWAQMGPTVALGDRTYKHPPQEPALGLCRRSVPGGDVVLAQCGQHIAYRNDSARQILELTGVAPRAPTRFVNDVGPMLSVAVLGTTVAVFSRSNRVFISTVVPAHDSPDSWGARFRVDPHNTELGTGVLFPVRPYRALCVTTTNIFALYMDGTLMECHPGTQPHSAPITDVSAEATK